MHKVEKIVRGAWICGEGFKEWLWLPWAAYLQALWEIDFVEPPKGEVPAP